MPPPPPPPPPPVIAASNGGSSKPMSKDLLTDIAKGARLKKVQTNDRSSPLIDSGKKNSSVNSPVPGPSGGSRPAMSTPSMGNLFANGVPLKPSDNKRAAKISAAPAVPPAPAPAPGSSSSSQYQTQAAPPPPPPPPPPPAAQSSQSSHAPPIPSAKKPTFGGSNVHNSAPPIVNTLMESRKKFEEAGTPLRNPGRPAGPPPARPHAPPPPPPPTVAVVASRPDSTPTISRIESRAYKNSSEPAPAPPPRVASRGPIQTMGIVSSLNSHSINTIPQPTCNNEFKDPLDRFTFLPISKLPAPPQRSRAF